ncbi:hypothetical protein H8790_11870 [Oscillibacter hominis]|uniref:Uncharacterized protein n=1 Tax=Oscillibacter hominis TaxID=2763056 RepID=A0A7G9B8P4_9FIRM|nr:hypothetical protein [Oscillibacter hominis]QNL45925.1 hypothetical protein H8790_11870 [Oscillibacter hominis]
MTEHFFEESFGNMQRNGGQFDQIHHIVHPKRPDGPQKFGQKAEVKHRPAGNAQEQV